jgi:KDO2-lipid IV(A) lauroyltransferase
LRANKKLKRLGEYGLVQIFFLLARLPRRMGQALFAALGGIAYRVLRKDQERAIDNLAIAFPETNEMVRRAMVKAMFRGLGRNLYEFLSMRRTRPEALGERIERVEGRERIAETFGLGRGMIVVTGHIGCWELMSSYFAATDGYPVSAVARRMKGGRLNDILVSIRGSFGVKTLDRENNPRDMLGVLHRGEVLGVLIDQHTAVAGAYVPFFGRPAHTPTAVAKIAILTGAPILPMAIYLARSGKHVIHVLPPIMPPRRPADREAAIVELTKDCSLAVENLIRIDPKQWVWFHHRWREPDTGDVVYAAEG